MTSFYNITSKGNGNDKHVVVSLRMPREKSGRNAFIAGIGSLISIFPPADRSPRLTRQKHPTELDAYHQVRREMLRVFASIRDGGMVKGTSDERVSKVRHVDGRS
jgi:hypothetical protein